MGKSTVGVDAASNLLAEASAGRLTFNDEFKAACALAVRVMRAAEKLANIAWGIKEGSNVESNT